MSSNLNFFHFKRHLIDRKDFRAGNKELEKYIKDQMAQFEDRNLSRNYVGIDEVGNFISLLCLSSSIITSSDLINSQESFPKDIDLPTIKIGRLVVDNRYRKKGYGERTLQKAISIFVEISKKIGVIGLSVDSKKEAVGFYKKYSFIELGSSEKTEFTPMILFTNTLKKIRPSLFEISV